MTRPIWLLVALLLALPAAHAAISYPEAIDPAGDGSNLGEPADIPSRLDLRSVQFRPHGPEQYQVVVGVADLIAFDAPGAFADGTTYQAWWVFFSAAGHDYHLDISADADGDAYAQLRPTDVEMGYGDHPRSDHEDYRFDDAPVELEFDEAADKIVVTLPREWMLTRPAPGVDGESVSFGPGTVFQLTKAVSAQGQGGIEPSAVGITANCGACFGADAAHGSLPYVMDAPEANPWLIASAGPDTVTVVNPTSIPQVFPMVHVLGAESVASNHTIPAGASFEMPIQPGALVLGAAFPVQWGGEVTANRTHEVLMRPAFHLHGAGSTLDPGVLAPDAPFSVLPLESSVEIDGVTSLGSWTTQPLHAPAHLVNAELTLPMQWQDAEGARLVIDVAGQRVEQPLPAGSGDETLRITIPLNASLAPGDALRVDAYLVGESGSATLRLHGDSPEAMLLVDAHLEAWLGATDEAGHLLLPLPFHSSLPHMGLNGTANIVQLPAGMFLHVVRPIGTSIGIEGAGWAASVPLDESLLPSQPPQPEAPDAEPPLPDVPDVDPDPVLGEEPLDSEASGQTTAPGSGNAWIAGAFVVFGLVAAYEATVITRKLRSRAAQRALDAPHIDGVMLRSQAAQRAMGRSHSKSITIRCEACKTVQWHGDAPECVECRHPLPMKVAP